MEVTPEVYAWLVNLNIIDGNKTLKMKKEGTILIQENVVNRFMDGYYFDKILTNLEENYNKFYKIKLTYTDKLKEMKNIEQGKSSNSMRYFNWKIISDILLNFGIDLDEDKIVKMTSGNKSILLNTLKNIYTLSSEFIKRSIDFSTTTQDSSARNVRKTTDSVDFNNINPDKDYNKCESLLEFFIVSLSKSLEMKPRQAIALLSNNRKYLLQIASRGIKGSYDKMISWYQDLSINARLISNLIKITKDTRSMCFATIAVGLYSKNYHVAMNAYNIVTIIQADNGSDWEWFSKEGIDAMIYCINRHDELRVNILNLIYEFGRKRVDDIITLINTKFDKEKIYEFFSSIISCAKKSSPVIFGKLKDFIIETCVKDVRDKCVGVSLLSDAWINFYPLDKHVCEVVIKYFKNGIRDKTNRLVQSTSIIHLFRLMQSLGSLKDEHAPIIYKTLVFLFLSGYDDNQQRELFLIQFSSIFKKDTNIPINIFLDPYLRQLKSSQNYDINDFKFLTQILEHPRLELENIKDVLHFATFICLTNSFYTRSGNLLLTLLFDKNLINPSAYDTCVNFIKNSTKLFIQNPTSPLMLEAPYDILNMNVAEINDSVEKDIVEANEYYRGEYNHYSLGLLAMLWFYDKHDDIILNLEEKYAERYEPSSQRIEEEKIIQQKKMKQSPEYTISMIKNKKINNVEDKRYQEQKNKMKERKIKKALEKQLQQRSMELGSINMTKISAIPNERSLIQKEGSFLNNLYSKNEQPYKYFTLPILLEDEEDREKTAIDGFLKQYNKQIKYYFNAYLTEVNNTITKANFLKFLRDVGIDNDILTLDELTVAIRNIFGLPLNTFEKDQFYHLIIQLSVFIFSKKKPHLTISMCFEQLLKLLVIPQVAAKKNKTKILLEEKLRINPYIPLPPGFKKSITQKVAYEFKIPDKFISFLPEEKIICLEIFNEIISKAVNSNVIESFVRIQNEPKIIIDNNDKPKWSNSIFMAYTELDKDQEPYGKDVGDILDEILKAIIQGRETIEKPKIIPPRERMEMAEYNKFIEEEAEKAKKRKLRRQIVKQKIKQMEEEKENNNQKRDEDLKKVKTEREEKLKLQLLKERKIREQMKKQTEKLETLAKKKKDEEKNKIEEEMKQREYELKQKKQLEKMVVVNRGSPKNRKLKEQFNKLKIQKNNFLEKQNDIPALPIVNIKKKLDNDKSYVEFEKVLSEKLEELLERNDIKEIMTEYDSHLKVIYYIYSRLGNNIISYSSDVVMRLNEFKEFCLNFAILGLLISNEQMTFIFRKISKRNEIEKNEQFYFKYNDFILSIMYICIMSKFTNRMRRILPSDLEQVDINTVKLLFEFLGLKKPFNKRELEEFINDRRALSAAQMLKLQTHYKKEKVGTIRPRSSSKPTIRAMSGKTSERSNNINNARTDHEKTNKSLADVSIDKLPTAKNIKIIDPSGKEENWNVKVQNK